MTRHAATFDRRDVVQAVAAAHLDGARREEIDRHADRLLEDAIPVQRANGDRAYTTRSVLEAERLVQTVTRLFDTSRQQERALDALERHPGAAQIIRGLDHATIDEASRSETAAVLGAELEQTFVLRRGRRHELAAGIERADGLAAHARDRIGELHKRFDQLGSDDAVSLPATEPEMRPGPDLSLDRGQDLDMGM